MKPAIATMLMLALLGAAPSHGDDWPMLGRDHTRNPVSPEKNPPLFWQIEGVPTKFDEQGRGIEEAAESKNIKWIAELGHLTLGDPVVSGGLVWVGTNNRRGPDEANAYVLKCFRESDGKLLYQHVTPRAIKGGGHEWGSGSFSCSPLAEGDRIWFVTNRSETVCLDVGPLRRGEGEPRPVWRVDMADKLGVVRRPASMALHRTSSAASYGDWIYVITGNGVDDAYQHVPAPEAPSLVCFEKETGKVVWQDNSPGANILYGQWASPLVIEIDGQPQCLAPQGDGWLRSFDPATGRLLWEFDLNPKTSKWEQGRGDRNMALATPVFYRNRIYLAVGRDAESGEGLGRLWCIDPTRRLDGRDVSPTLGVDSDGNRLPRRRLQAVDLALGEREIPNPDSAVVWHYFEQDRNGDGKIEFEERMHRTTASVAIHDGLLIAADLSGLVHCLDAQSGKVHWTHDLLTAIYAPPLIVDGKAYLADWHGDVTIFALSKEKRLIATHCLGDSVYCAPVFANGVLYIASRGKLVAIHAEAAPLGGHWPQWRGPHRDNVSTEKSLAKQWPEDGPPLRWRVQGLGLGISTVSIADGRVFTLSQYETTEYIRALDEQTGDPLWSAQLGEAPPQSLMMRWLTQRPPTVDGERLYAMSLLGDLLCLQAADGKELWRRNFAAEFAGERGLFGYSDCPIVCDDKLLCTPGGAEASIVALDKATGEVIWKCPVANGGKAAYANGVVAEIAGQTQFVTFLEKALVGVAVEDGKLLWRVDGVADVGFHPHTPLIHGNAIACINAFGQGGIRRLELERRESAWSVKEAYAIKSSHLAQYQDDTVLREDRLYEFHRGVASCFDFATGQILWQRRLGGAAAMTWADGRFYLYRPGEAIDLVEAHVEGPVVTARCTLPQAGNASGASTPVIAGGRLYVRMDDQLFCYDVRQDAMGRSPTAASVIELPPPNIGAAQQAGRPRTGVHRAPDAVFVPTPHDVVAAMLQLAGVKKQDVVYDLGSGDGRIVIAAAKTYGVQAVGVEIDPELVNLSQRQAKESKLEDLVKFSHDDMFQVDLSQTDVVAVFLYPRLLERLRPQFAKMKPGSRIVSHQFLMPDVEPDQEITMESAETGDRHMLYLWTTPLKVASPRAE